MGFTIRARRHTDKHLAMDQRARVGPAVTAAAATGVVPWLPPGSYNGHTGFQTDVSGKALDVCV